MDQEISLTVSQLHQHNLAITIIQQTSINKSCNLG